MGALALPARLPVGTRTGVFVKAGRALDALIAERITKVGHEGASAPLLYSTRIEDAMRVAEMFVMFSVGTTMLADVSPVVPFARVWHLGEWTTAYGETPAHSICLAALKARGVESR